MAEAAGIKCARICVWRVLPIGASYNTAPMNDNSIMDHGRSDMRAHVGASPRVVVVVLSLSLNRSFMSQLNLVLCPHFPEREKFNNRKQKKKKLDQSIIVTSYFVEILLCPHGPTSNLPVLFVRHLINIHLI